MVNPVQVKTILVPVLISRYLLAAARAADQVCGLGLVRVRVRVGVTLRLRLTVGARRMHVLMS